MWEIASYGMYVSVGLMTSLVIFNLLMSVGRIPNLYWAMVHGEVM